MALASRLGGWVRRTPWAVPLAPVALAALLYLPRLGSYGFFEPHEIAIADRARGLPEVEAADVEEAPGPGPAAPGAAGAADEPGAANEPGVVEPRRVKPATRTERPVRHTLTDVVAAAGIEHVGASEAGARSLLALLGVLAVGAVTLLGVRLGNRRAGALAGLVFLSFPLVVVESRHLTSEIGTLTGAALIALGLVGLVRRTAGPLRPSPGALLDVVVLALGWWLAERGGATWNGLLPPITGVGVGALAAGLGGEAADGVARRDRRLVVAGVALLVLALGLLVGVVREVFVVVDAAVGDRAVFGKALLPAVRLFDGVAIEHGEIVRVAGDGGFRAALGGTWRAQGDPNLTATALFEQIAFGTFPWIALIPLAIAGLGRAGRLAAVTLGTWALVAWVMATIYAGKVAVTTYPAYAALAVAVGLWLDARWSRPDGAPAATDDPDPAGQPLPVAALFALLAVVVVGKDLIGFPDQLSSLALLGKTLKWPEGSKLHLVLPLLGVGFAVAISAAIALVDRVGRRRLAGRFGVAALGFAMAGALFVSQILPVGLSDRLSSRGMFATYAELRKGGEKLGIVGDPGPSARFYAGDDIEPLRGKNQLIEFLQRPERVFALTRRVRRAGESAGELCGLAKQARATDLDLHVLDDSNEQFVLLSNRLGRGEADLDPLAGVILRQPPADLGTPLDAEFESTLRLRGVRLPARVGRGERFDVTLIFEALKPVNRNWKVFVHFDSGATRFQGDHEPMRGLCGTTSLSAGDIVLDTFTVKAGSRVDGTPTGRYRVFAGFFVGTSPNYTNMKVSRGAGDSNDRIPIATIELD